MEEGCEIEKEAAVRIKGIANTCAMKTEGRGAEKFKKRVGAGKREEMGH